MTNCFESVNKCSAVNYVNNLPEELLIKIFSYFDFFDCKNLLSFVCKKWLELCKDPFLYRNYLIEDPLMSTDEVREMLNAAPFLMSLTISDRKDLHRIMKTISRGNRKIKMIRINRCQGTERNKEVDSSLLIRYLKRCPDLEKLIVKNTLLSDGYERCYLYGLGLVLPNLRKLTLVNISITLIEREITLISETCKKLESIKILQTQGTQLTDQFIETICTTLNSTLKVLKMNGPFLSNNSIMKLKTCKNLQTLHLKYALRITCKVINTLSEINSLTSLDLTMALNINSKNWVLLFSQKSMQIMLKLVIGQCDTVNDEVLEIIGHNCPILSKLGLSGCCNITESGLMYVAMGCKNMTYLDLFYTPRRITNMFHMIPKCMPKLKKLIYRSSDGCDGGKQMVRHLTALLPDLIFSDTTEDYCFKKYR